MENTDLPDLVARSAAGDQQAWDEIVSRFTNLLWSVARSFRLRSEDAGDVVQTTWLRLVENLDRIEDPQRLPGWLTTTARRECLAVLRRRGREVVIPDQDLDGKVRGELAEPIDLLLLEDERDAKLWSCFTRLTERCQRLLRVLMAAEPPAYCDVASSLGMPVGSIGPTRMRCLSRLRVIVDETGYAFDASAQGSMT